MKEISYVPSAQKKHLSQAKVLFEQCNSLRMEAAAKLARVAQPLNSHHEYKNCNT